MTRGGQALIAERLSLSQATVSRALRNHSGISPEIRARVLSVAGEVGYVSNRGDERGGAREQAKFVGVLVNSESDRWRRGGYLMGMSEASPELNVTPCVHHVDSAKCEEILDPRRQPPLMRDGMLQGLVLVFRWPDHIVAELSKRFACVSLQHEYPRSPVQVVGLNAIPAMARLMQHLFDLGHRRIGFFGRCPSFGWAERRFDGYVAATVRMDVEAYSPVRVVPVSDLDLQSVDRDQGNWDPYIDAAFEQTRAGVTAWMAASDYLGYQLCRGLQARGLYVPRDVSVTGFDVSDHGAFDCGKLTSVIVPSREMGAASLSLAKEPRRPAVPLPALIYDCVFDIGETTGPVSSRKP
jgi:DNA-binding LacI/PurR family transcriptional regulator